MDLTFRRKDDRRLAEDEKAARKKLGPVGARKLRARLADLRAARVLGEVVAGSPHPLTGDRAGEFAVTVHEGVRLVFVAADAPVPRSLDGRIDWRNVTQAEVIFIGDYHD